MVKQLYKVSQMYVLKVKVVESNQCFIFPEQNEMEFEKQIPTTKTPSFTPSCPVLEILVEVHSVSVRQQTGFTLSENFCNMWGSWRNEYTFLAHI